MHHFSSSLVKTQCHRGPVVSLAIDPTGMYMVTAGADKTIKVWDLRTYKNLHSYRTINRMPATTLDISQRGVLGAGHGATTTFWNDAFNTSNNEPENRRPYMTHNVYGKTVQSLRFRPYEDVCGIGHSHGISSIVIPGSGEPNLDSLENANPYADRKQRREAEVRNLLDKLPYEMITLDTNMVGRIRRDQRDASIATAEAMKDANRVNAKHDTPVKEKNRMRGRSKVGKKLGRKQKNVIDAQVLKLREARKLEKQKVSKESTGIKGEDFTSVRERKKAEAPLALKRFFD